MFFNSVSSGAPSLKRAHALGTQLGSSSPFRSNASAMFPSTATVDNPMVVSQLAALSLWLEQVLTFLMGAGMTNPQSLLNALGNPYMDSGLGSVGSASSKATQGMPSPKNHGSGGSGGTSPAVEGLPPAEHTSTPAPNQAPEVAENVREVVGPDGKTYRVSSRQLRGSENGGKHHIYVSAVDANGNPIDVPFSLVNANGAETRMSTGGGKVNKDMYKDDNYKVVMNGQVVAQDLTTKKVKYEEEGNSLFHVSYEVKIEQLPSGGGDKAAKDPKKDSSSQTK